MTTCEAQFCEAAAELPLAVVEDAEDYQFQVCRPHMTAVADGVPADVGWDGDRPVLFVGGLRCG